MLVVGAADRPFQTSRRVNVYGGLFIYGASIGAITLLYRAADVPHHRLLVPSALATAELLVGLSVYGLFSIAPDTMNIPFAYAVGASLLAYTLLLHGVISLLLYEPRRPDPSETFAFTLSPTVMPGEARTLPGLAATLHTRF